MILPRNTFSKAARKDARGDYRADQASPELSLMNHSWAKWRHQEHEGARGHLDMSKCQHITENFHTWFGLGKTRFRLVWLHFRGKKLGQTESFS